MVLRIMFALARLVQKLLAKNSIVIKYRYFDFLPRCDVYFSWHENDLSKHFGSCPLVSCIQCRLSLVASLLRFRALNGDMYSLRRCEVDPDSVGAQVNKK